GAVTASEFRPLLDPDHLPEEGGFPDKLQENERKVLGIASQTFHFLNRSYTFPSDEINWHTLDVSHLWRYQLHYFSVTEALMLHSRTSRSEFGFVLFRRLALSWMQQNPPLHGDGWHPYTLSMRIVNWIHALHGFRRYLDSDPEFSGKMANSLARQAGYLSRDLEFDVRGNHLLKNIKALIFYSLAVSDARAEQYFKTAIGLLQSECNEQVLIDGGHFERTPGYHVDVLADLIDIGLFLKRNRSVSYNWLDGSVRRMLDWLTAIIMPGNALPVIKDTSGSGLPGVHCLDILASGALYLQDPAYKLTPDLGLYGSLRFDARDQKRFRQWPLHEETNDSRMLASSGYAVLRQNQGRNALILDVGKPCPDYLPAHAHADMLSYELYLDDMPAIVDSGVHEYAPGAWRDFFRSTRAHNTVALDDQNQSEVYGSFRVARRARPCKRSWSLEGDLKWVRAGHDGYHRLPQHAEHTRTVAALPGLWVIFDEVTAMHHVDVTSYIHLYPDLQFVRAKGDSWQIAGLKTDTWVTCFGIRQKTLVKGREGTAPQGWYSPEFGRKLPNWVLTLSQHGAGRLQFGYVIASGRPAEIDRVESHPAGCHMTFSQEDSTTTLLFKEKGVSKEP
ncbi:MAG: hypothetical protein GY697_24430, partial [Desulfobacterales bacterium]|nr:hypothetical protein [Desulfobacterales bacterium]